MIIIEQLNENIYLGKRENAGWGYRCVIQTEVKLAVGQQINSDAPIDCSIESLCFAAQNFFFGQFSEEVDLTEQAKQLYIEVLSGEEDAEWTKSFAFGNGIL